MPASDLADDGLTGEVPAGELAADQDYRRAGECVAGVEAAALQERHADRLEVAVRHDLRLRERPLVRRKRAVGDVEAPQGLRVGRVELGGKRQPDRRAGRDHARLAAQQRQQPLVKHHPLVHVPPVARHRPRQIERHGQHAVGPEAERLLLQQEERPPEQPGAHDEGEAQRELHDDQRAVPDEAARAWPARPAVLAQRVFEVRPRSVPRRQQTAQNARRERNREADDDHAGVDTDRVQTRQMRRRHDDEGADADDGERDADARAEKRQQPRLDENLARQAPPAGAERGAHRVLAGSRDRSAERQAGDVAAGNEQDAGNGAEDREQHRPRRADDLVDERRHRRPPAGVGIRKALGLQLRQPVELGVRLLRRDRRGEPADGVERALRAGKAGGVERQRNPEVRGFAVRQRALGPADVLQTWRDHAHDLERPARQVDRAPDDRRIGAEPRPPDPVAEDDPVGIARAARPDA